MPSPFSLWFAILNPSQNFSQKHFLGDPNTHLTWPGGGMEQVRSSAGRGLLSCYHRMGWMQSKKKSLGKLKQSCVGLGSLKHNMHQLLPPEQALLPGRQRILAQAVPWAGSARPPARGKSTAHSSCSCFQPLGACPQPASRLLVTRQTTIPPSKKFSERKKT